jgi:hypothetical protein
MEDNNRRENQMKFSDYKIAIVAALNGRLAESKLGISESVDLVDGFFMQSFQDTLDGIQLGGKSIPSIVLVGKDSGRLYFIALKALLPDIEI